MTRRGTATKQELSAALDGNAGIDTVEAESNGFKFQTDTDSALLFDLMNGKSKDNDLILTYWDITVRGTEATIADVYADKYGVHDGVLMTAKQADKAAKAAEKAKIKAKSKN